jgi:hypothetical protein
VRRARAAAAASASANDRNASGLPATTNTSCCDDGEGCQGQIAAADGICVVGGDRTCTAHAPAWARPATSGCVCQPPSSVGTHSGQLVQYRWRVAAVGSRGFLNGIWIPASRTVASALLSQPRHCLVNKRFWQREIGKVGSRTRLLPKLPGEHLVFGGQEKPPKKPPGNQRGSYGRVGRGRKRQARRKKQTCTQALNLHALSEILLALLPFGSQ